MKYVTRKRILKFSHARKSRNWLKRIRFKRYGNLSLYRFIKIYTFNIDEDEVFDRANGVAYNFILATFPAIIFLFTLIPYISNYFPEVSQESIMEFLKEMIPANMYEIVSSTLLDIISNQRGGLLTVGFIMALYLSTNGMNALMRAFNACYRTVEKRSWFRMRLTSLGLTIMMTLALFSAIAFLVVGQIVLNYVTEHIAEYSHLKLDGFTLSLLFILRFLILFFVFFIAISFIFYFAPAVHYNWNFFSIGSFLATLAVLGVSYGFSYYISHFASYNKVYGSIGALIALMAWIQLMTLILLFGYEVNASLHYATKLEAAAVQARGNKRLTKASR